MTLDNALTGTWILLSFNFTGDDGSVYQPLGDSPAGALTFTPDGYVTFSFTARDRAAFESDDPFVGGETERAAAAAGYVTFGGPYRIEENAVVIDVEFSLFPNWVGGQQKRLFELDGDRLTLRTDGARLFGGEMRRAEARLRRAGSSA